MSEALPATCGLWCVLVTFFFFNDLKKIENTKLKKIENILSSRDSQIFPVGDGLPSLCWSSLMGYTAPNCAKYKATVPWDPNLGDFFWRLR